MVTFFLQPPLCTCPRSFLFPRLVFPVWQLFQPLTLESNPNFPSYVTTMVSLFSTTMIFLLLSTDSIFDILAFLSEEANWQPAIIRWVQCTIIDSSSLRMRTFYANSSVWQKTIHVMYICLNGPLPFALFKDSHNPTTKGHTLEKNSGISTA